MPSTPQEKSGDETLISSRVLPVVRKTITPAIAPSLQKTSDGLVNLRTGDW